MDGIKAMTFDPTKPMNEPLTARIEAYLSAAVPTISEARSTKLLREALAELKDAEADRQERLTIKAAIERDLE